MIFEISIYVNKNNAVEYFVVKEQGQELMYCGDVVVDDAYKIVVKKIYDNFVTRELEIAVNIEDNYFSSVLRYYIGTFDTEEVVDLDEENEVIYKVYQSQN